VNLTGFSISTMLPNLKSPTSKKFTVHDKLGALNSFYIIKVSVSVEDAARD